MTSERAERLRKAAVVLNAGSRSGRRALPKIRAAFGRIGVQPDHVYAVEDGERLVEATRAALAGGAPIVIVGGGDGTATTVADAIATSGATFGLLPLGTGNSFARSLGVPLRIEDAVETLASGIVREIDLGRANGRAFVNYAAIGLSANVAGSTPARLKAVLGPLAYLAAGFILTRRHRPFAYELVAGDEDAPRFSGMTHQIVVANGKYFGTVAISPNASLDSGEFATFAIEGAHRRGLERFWLRAIGGIDPRTLPEGRYFSASRVRLRTTPPRVVEIDGQELTKTPVDFTIDRRALRVIVPRDSTELDAAPDPAASS